MCRGICVNGGQGGLPGQGNAERRAYQLKWANDPRTQLHLAQAFETAPHAAPAPTPLVAIRKKKVGLRDCPPGGGDSNSKPSSARSPTPFEPAEVVLDDYLK